MQSMQMLNPHRHRQQNGKVPRQQWQSPEAAFLRRCRYEDSFFFILKTYPSAKSAKSTKKRP
jgi:hypothetical protein